MRVTRGARGGRIAVAGALFSLLLASCTSSGDPSLQLSAEGYNNSAAMMPSADGAPGDAGSVAANATANDAGLPAQVAYLPAANPNGVQKPDEAAISAVKSDKDMPVKADKQAEITAAKSADEAKPATASGAVLATAAVPQAKTPKKKSFFGSMFGTSSASAAPVHSDRSGAAAPVKKPVRETIVENIPAKGTGKETVREAPPANLELDMASLSESSSGKIRKPVQLASYTNEDDALPGVRASALFEIKRKSGIDDDSDVDIHEEDEFSGGVQLASAAGMARLAPNGLLKQTESVDVACLKPSLVRVLKVIERRYGRKLIVTSGYRSRARNIAARGARNSMHMYCAAADIQVPGVSKWELATFLRGMPNRGGVGTYCHTNSVHVDIGPERDWNWRCRRRG